MDAPAPAGAAWPAPSVTQLGHQVAELRDALFSLGDVALKATIESADVHVALQAAAHQLGVAERLLLDTP